MGVDYEYCSRCEESLNEYFLILVLFVKKDVIIVMNVMRII